MANILEPIKNY